MRAIWKEIAKDNVKGKWAAMYATLSPRGEIVISRVTWEKTGGPAAYLVLFDEANNRIGLKPTALGIKNAFAASPRGKHGGRRIMVYRLIAEHSLKLKHTLQFLDAEIDPDGILILDLRTATINKTSLAWHRRRVAEEAQQNFL